MMRATLRRALRVLTTDPETGRPFSCIGISMQFALMLAVLAIPPGSLIGGAILLGWAG